MSGLVERLLAGDRLAAARLITQAENGSDAVRADMAALYPHTGRAHIVGVTGAPGTGKSTLVNQIARELRRRQRTIGIVAVDPTSPFTGGAILGDRIRMQDLAGDPGVFIRSMATRGSLGGLSRATMDAVKVLDAFGRDIIIIETVGVGQDEVEIAKSAHTTLVLQMPTLGDDIQILKAGILEIADVLVINKADLPNADRVRAALRMMLDLSGDVKGWSPPIIKAVATTGEGVPAVVEAIEQHHAYLRESNRLVQREEQRVRDELLLMLRDELAQRTLAALPEGRLDNLVQQVTRRTLDPYRALQEIIQNA